MSEFVASFGHPFADDTREKVGVIVYDNAGHVLLVQGMTGKISLPKGGRLRGETELEGAVREAWEETGIDLEKTTYILKTKLIWGDVLCLQVERTCKRAGTAPTSWRNDSSVMEKPNILLAQPLGPYEL